ncbi:hypothetical protein IFO69_09165 [Echinicola sp. CAU 1574]|uniref:Uncharacterized protein n=1 Tax=Echinicola arenosa TaxID=2774144 RepID=A0ABR9AKN2_9BACT|nr:hypothetical protein [Echinicola arenosa]MBD8488912.1 hypothetical protein [Echinicola arenosa]
MARRNPIFTPELIKVIKIFGLASVGIVLVFSFFNEYRADNTGDAEVTHITDASRLYFKNVRQIYYDIERRDDAKVDIFRYSRNSNNKKLLFLNLSIILSRIKNEAYIFVEPSEALEKQEEIEIRWKNQSSQKQGEIYFRFGDRFTHYDFVSKLAPLIEENIDFEVKFDQEWQPILVSEKERFSFKVTAEDYFRLVE